MDSGPYIVAMTTVCAVTITAQVDYDILWVWKPGYGRQKRGKQTTIMLMKLIFYF